MKKPVYTPEEEQQLMAQLWSPLIADDPLAFVMFAFPWGQKGTPLAKFEGPRKWQRKVLRRIARHIREGKELDLAKLLRIARASGRGIGKSALVAWLVFWFLTTRIGSTIIISANTETQLRKITWAEIGKWATMAINAHWWEVVGITVRPAKWLAELVERDLKKGTDYWAAEGKLWSEESPDSYAGVHNHDGVMVIFDEASGIPDSIWSVANGFFTEPTFNRFWFAFSQGRRNSGYFYEIFGKKREQWDAEQIDARDVEGTDPQVYQEIIDEYGEDSDEVRVEVYGQFPESDDISFISPTTVEKAAKRQLRDDPTAPVILGVDPAGSGASADWFTITARQGEKQLEIRRFKLTDDEIGTMEGVGHTIQAIEDFEPQITNIDSTGMGGPIADRLREQGYKVRKVNFAWKSIEPQRYGNKRAEMWGKMKKWLETGQILDDKRLKADLQGPKKKPDSKNVMLLESKKDMKARGLASPDAGDALALTFAHKVARRENSGYNKTASKRAEQAYEPATTGWMGH